MIGLMQRVNSAQVVVADEVIGEIGRGLLVFLGMEREDDEKKAFRLIERLLTYRVFADSGGKMNLNVQDVRGGLLLVPQFTLAADTQSGTRPGFSSAALPEKAEILFNYCVCTANARYDKVSQGRFAADMAVTLTNDGPVTFWLQT
ncbi:MAG TPA: D-tyrosyl-tRNA(Tyr) deacylase [Gammaproteobacteria bacterium]|nr:D-tyrosyl-tRNA(Tyr) deacylase [Gammaproteobacteria bacterium]